MLYILKYDADAGIMEIGIYDEDVYHNRRGGGPADYSIQLYRDTTSTETYVGSNAYGATREVESSRRVRATLLFPADQLSSDMPRKYENLKLPMSADRGRRFKADPSLLIVAKLRAPYLVYDYERSAATIDYPYETRRHSYGLKVNLECLVLMSGSEEVHRLSFSN